MKIEEIVRRSDSAGSVRARGEEFDASNDRPTVKHERNISEPDIKLGQVKVTHDSANGDSDVKCDLNDLPKKFCVES